MTAKITSSSRAVKARVGSTWRLRHEGRLREQFCALPGHPFRRLRNHLSAPPLVERHQKQLCNAFPGKTPRIHAHRLRS